MQSPARFAFPTLIFLVAIPGSLMGQGISTVRVASGLERPVFVTHAPGDADRLFIVEKDGEIEILDLQAGTLNAVPFLTIADTDSAGDGGLIGLAFHPEYASNGRFFVYVTIDNGGVGGSPFSSHIREYAVSGDPDIADTTPIEILSFAQPRTNHNAGWIGFNPEVIAGEDRYLHICSGDGGIQHDPDDNAQTIENNLLGKILRIDVNGDDFPADATRNYAIPPTNPFVSLAGDDEIWAYGLRNPWKAAFDRLTGDFYIGDVGQNDREEIDVIPAGAAGGINFAWNRREGFIAHDGGSLLPGDTEPIYDYERTGDFGGRSTVGGYVHRGSVSCYRGRYLFADTILDNVWCFDPDDPINSVRRINDELVPDVGSLNQIVSFGEDAVGELYIVDYGSTTGEIFRIVETGIPAGDLNGDGAVSSLDADLLVLVLLNLDPGDDCATARADVNGDAQRDGRDIQAWIDAL